MPVKILLTGSPGVGKTTVTRDIARLLGKRARGFYTEERREGRARVGFDIVTLEGRRASLSHVDIKSPHRVGKYGVDLEAMDSLGVAAIQRALAEGRVIIIDEIGKMELYSRKFRETVTRAFDSTCHVVAVIMKKPNPFADSIKGRPDIKLIEVTMANRESLAERIVEEITK